MSNKQLVEDLRATREVLVSRGRCTGDLMKMDGKVCLDGAIGIATIYNYEGMILLGQTTCYAAMHLDKRCQAVLHSLARCLPESFLKEDPTSSLVSQLFNFNDHIDTTDEDVLGLVDKALAQEGGLAD